MINTILITGTKGFIGSKLYKYFSELKFRIITYNQYLTYNSNDSKLNTLLANEKPHFVIHCAGSSSVALAIAKPMEDFEKNVIATEKLCHAIVNNSPQSKLIFLSSAAVYGNPIDLPINENTSTSPISHYGYHKLMGELICKKYHQLYHMSALILRIFSVYGPNLKKQILWDIYQKSLTSKTIKLYGTGNETRDFIYIDDLLRLIHQIVVKFNFEYDILNIATGNEISIRTLAHLMLSKMKDEFDLEFSNKEKCGDPKRWQVDTKLLNQLFNPNWTTFETGIQHYIDWLISEQPA